jgi:hypothetical protein
MHLANRHRRRAILRHLKVKRVPVGELKPLGRETRQHPPVQIQKIVASLNAYGLVLPILTDTQNRVIKGWALVLAGRQLGLAENICHCFFTMPSRQSVAATSPATPGTSTLAPTNESWRSPITTAQTNRPSS